MVEMVPISSKKGKYVYSEKQIQTLLEREYFTFYVSYFEMIDQLEDDMQLLLYRSITHYSFRGIQPDFTQHPQSRILQALWSGIEPNIRSNTAHYLNGKETKNKSKKSETEAKPKRDRSEGGAIINNKEENKKRNIEKEDRSIEEIMPPTLQDVSSYVSSIGSTINPERFYNHYTAIGWVDKNGNPIKDWKSVVNQWQVKEKYTPDIRRISEIEGVTLEEAYSMFHDYGIRL